MIAGFFEGIGNPMVTIDVDKWLKHFTAARSKAEKEVTLVIMDDFLNELNLLSTALTMSEREVNISQAVSISTRLHSRRQELEPILTKLLQDDPKMEVDQMLGFENAEGDENGDQDQNGSNAEESKGVESVKAECDSSRAMDKKGGGKGKKKSKSKKNKKTKGRKN